MLLQVSVSTVARAPSLSCLSRPCVRFMFLPWALASHFGMFYCNSGSKVFSMSYGGFEFAFVVVALGLDSKADM